MTLSYISSVLRERFSKMIMLHALIVVVFSWGMIPESFAAVAADKPGGIVTLEQLKERALQHPLEEISTKRAISAIVTLKMSAEPLLDAEAPVARREPRLPIQEKKTFRMMERVANSYEKTLIIEWLATAFVLGLVDYVDEVLAEGTTAAQRSQNRNYKRHVKTLEKAWGLVTRRIEPVEKPGTIPIFDIVTENGQQIEVPAGVVPVTVKTLGKKYKYFNTDLDPAITGPLQDEAAVQTAQKALENGTPHPVIKKGFVKFMENVKANYYLKRAFPSPHCIVRGVPYVVTPIPPSQPANFGGTPYHISHLISILDPTVSHKAYRTLDTDPWFHQSFKFFYDGPCLAGISTPSIPIQLKTEEEKETKRKAIISYPFNPGFVLRQHRGHEPSFGFLNQMTISPSCFMIPPPDQRRENILCGLGFYTATARDPQPYSLTALEDVLVAGRVYTSLAVVSPTVIAFTYQNNLGHPASNLMVVKQTDGNALEERGTLDIQATEPIYLLVKGAGNISYAFEGKNHSLRRVHILALSAPNDNLNAGILPVACDFDTFISHTLTLQRNLIVAGVKNGNTTINIIRVYLVSGQLKHKVEERNLGDYTISQMLYFPEAISTDPITGQETIIPTNITLTGPQGTRIIPLNLD